MRFLADQDVYAATIRFLIGLGHDVIPASQAGLSEAENLTLVRTAAPEPRRPVPVAREFGRSPDWLRVVVPRNAKPSSVSRAFLAQLSIPTLWKKTVFTRRASEAIAAATRRFPVIAGPR